MHPRFRAASISLHIQILCMQIADIDKHHALFHLLFEITPCVMKVKECAEKCMKTYAPLHSLCCIAPWAPALL